MSRASDLKRAVGFVVGSTAAFVVLTVALAVGSSLSVPAVLACYLISLVVGGGLGRSVAARLPDRDTTE